MKNIRDSAQPGDSVRAIMQTGATVSDGCLPLGSFDFRCTDSDGNTLWEEHVDNLFTTVGKGQILTAAYAGSAYTAVEYMGLISSVGFSTLVAADTMASHAGWNEAQNSGTNTPSYGTVRPTATYGATVNGTITSSACTFVATSAGTIEGGFIVGGSGASATVGNTGGVLMNEGTLPTAQPVISGNTVIITHSGTLT